MMSIALHDECDVSNTAMTSLFTVLHHDIYGCIATVCCAEYVIG